MTRFDPARHRVVAVPYRDDDPERGQHFHVDLDALVEAAKEAAATALVPQQSGELVAVPAFEERKVATLEKRLTEALGEIDDLRTELQSRPSFSGEHLENIRSGIHMRLHEVVRDEVTAVLSNWSAISELRQELERVSREMAPSKHMEAISNVSKDVANLHESTAKALAVMEDCVKEVEVKMQRAADDMLATLHTEQASTLKAVVAAMEEAKASFHSNMQTRVDRFFRDPAVESA